MSSESGSTLTAIRKARSTNAAAVGWGLPFIAAAPTVWATGVGLPCTATGDDGGAAAPPAGRVGCPGALVDGLPPAPPQAAMIEERVAALVPIATSRRKRRRSRPR